MTAGPIKSVLIVELKSLPTWHHDLAAGFEALGVAATTFVTSPQSVAERVEKSFGGKKWYTSPLVLARLVARCRATQPDLIIFLGMFVLPAATVAALESALNSRPLLGAWVCDCFRQPQFEHWVPADHVFYFDTFMETILPDYYPDASRCAFLPLAADPRRYRPLRGGRREPGLVFVGNVSPNRAAVLDAIADRLTVQVYGPNSARNRRNRRKKLDSETINALYNAHPMVLNINQSPNTEYGANLRTFEVPATGGVLLTQASRDLEQHYSPGTEVLVWHTVDDLVAQYQDLNTQPARLAAIAAAGLRRTRADHAFVNRARTMLEVLSR